MPENFISNTVLRTLLSKATSDEKLALSKILDNKRTTPYDPESLQEKICLCGEHGVTNWDRNSGTGYLDIIDDVAEALKIENRPNYDEEVKYFDEVCYVKKGKDDQPDSKQKTIYDRSQAIILGSEYAIKYEKEILIKIMEHTYKEIESKAQEKEEELRLRNFRNIEFQKRRYDAYVRLMAGSTKDKREFQHFSDNNFETSEKMKALEIELTKLKSELENFDDNLSETIKLLDSNHIGVITGTAGFMVLANLGGFATYTFLTSMMSTLSFGTLGFGAYTAATSFLSVIIGPVGWTGLGFWAVFKLGKPNMNKLVLLVATIGAIRQRTLYENVEEKN